MHTPPLHAAPASLRQGSELPDIKAILVLDADGARVSAKFYSREEFPDKAAGAEFER